MTSPNRGRRARRVRRRGRVAARAGQPAAAGTDPADVLGVADVADVFHTTAERAASQFTPPDPSDMDQQRQIRAPLERESVADCASALNTVSGVSNAAKVQFGLEALRESVAAVVYASAAEHAAVAAEDADGGEAGEDLIVVPAPVAAAAGAAEAAGEEDDEMGENDDNGDDDDEEEAQDDIDEDDIDEDDIDEDDIDEDDIDEDDAPTDRAKFRRAAKGISGVANVMAGMFGTFLPDARNPDPVEHPMPVLITEDSSATESGLLAHFTQVIDVTRKALGHSRFVLHVASDLQIVQGLHDLRNKNAEIHQHIRPKLGLGHLRWNLGHLIIKRYDRGIAQDLALLLGTATGKKLLRSSKNRDHMDVIVSAFQLFLSGMLRMYLRDEHGVQLSERGGGERLEQLLQSIESVGPEFMQWGATRTDSTFKVVWSFMWNEASALIDLYVGTRAGHGGLLWASVLRAAHMYMPSSHVKYCAAVHEYLVEHLEASPVDQWLTEQFMVQSVTGRSATLQAIDELQEYLVIKEIKHAIRHSRRRIAELQRACLLHHLMKPRTSTTSVKPSSSSSIQRLLDRFSPARLGSSAIDLKSQRRLRSLALDDDAEEGVAVREAIASAVTDAAHMLTGEAVVPEQPAASVDAQMHGAEEERERVGPDEGISTAAFRTLRGKERPAGLLLADEITEEEVAEVLTMREEALRASVQQGLVALRRVRARRRGDAVVKTRGRLLRKFLTFERRKGRRRTAAAPKETTAKRYEALKNIGEQLQSVQEGPLAQYATMSLTSAQWLEVWSRKAAEALSDVGLTVDDLDSATLASMTVIATRFVNMYGISFEVGKAASLDTWLDALGVSWEDVYRVTPLVREADGVVVLADAIAGLYGARLPVGTTWAEVYDILLARFLRFSVNNVLDSIDKLKVLMLYFDDTRLVPLVKAWLNRSVGVQLLSADAFTFDPDEDAMKPEYAEDIWERILAHKDLRHTMMKQLQAYAVGHLFDEEVWRRAGLERPTELTICVELEHDAPVAVSWRAAAGGADGVVTDATAAVRAELERVRSDHGLDVHAIAAGEGEAKVGRALRYGEVHRIAKAVLRDDVDCDRLQPVVVTNDSDGVPVALLNTSLDETPPLLFRPCRARFLDVAAVRDRLLQLPFMDTVPPRRRLLYGIAVLRSFGADYALPTRAFGRCEKTMCTMLASGELWRCVRMAFGDDDALLERVLWEQPSEAVEVEMPSLSMAALLLALAAALATPGRDWAGWRVRSRGGAARRVRDGVPSVQLPHALACGLRVWLRDQGQRCRQQLPPAAGDGHERWLDMLFTVMSVNASLRLDFQRAPTALPLPFLLRYAAEHLRLDLLTLVLPNLEDVQSFVWTTVEAAKAGTTWDDSQMMTHAEAREGDALPVRGLGLVARRRKGVCQVQAGYAKKKTPAGMVTKAYGFRNMFAVPVSMRRRIGAAEAAAEAAERGGEERGVVDLMVDDHEAAAAEEMGEAEEGEEMDDNDELWDDM